MEHVIQVKKIDWHQIAKNHDLVDNYRLVLEQNFTRL